MTAQALFYLANKKDVIQTLKKMSSDQRIAWLYQIYLSVAPLTLTKEQGLALKQILSPYIAELSVYLNGQYEAVQATIIDANTKKQLAVKHYIMMKKLELYI